MRLRRRPLVDLINAQQSKQHDKHQSVARYVQSKIDQAVDAHAYQANDYADRKHALDARKLQ